MVEKKIINDAIELVENIPSTDEPTLESFNETEQPDISNDSEGEVISEYEVVVENSLYKFNKKVNDMIKQDWTTCGGVSVVQTSTGIKFYQAMERWTGTRIGLNIPGLEEEPDLYEDVEEDAIDG